MLAALGRKTLGNAKPTLWTFFAPMVWGVVLGGLWGALTLNFWGGLAFGASAVGLFGGLYLFFFGHYKRALVFFLGGQVGAMIGGAVLVGATSLIGA